MNGIIIASPQSRKVFEKAFEGAAFGITWVEDPGVRLEGVYDFLLDLEFSTTSHRIEPDAQRVVSLSNWYVPLIMIDSVAHSLKNLEADQRFVRINAWNTFLQRPVMEAVIPESAAKRMADFCAAWGKELEALPDVVGMPSVRIVSMIINEAWFALGEGVSDKDSIDTAMKLGTNYPKGPFEWCKQIGAPLVYQLLLALSKENTRYTIAPLLQQEALCH
jgi:3-hydroxybutyryl-CoA dehydrogenase